MPQLHEVLGALLRDIAQARVTSDLYSREVSRQYERDAILRAFPAPRTEIVEVELDLKFAVSSVEIDPDRRTSQRTAVAGFFNTLSEEIVRALFARLGDNPGRGAEAGRAVPGSSRVQAKLSSPQLWQKLAEEIYYFLQDHRAELVTGDQILEVRRIAREIQGILLRLLATDAGGPEEESSATLAVAEAGPVISRILAAQAEAFAGLSLEDQCAADYKIEVEIACGKLQEIPSSAISSVKVKTGIRNYLWTKVGEAGAADVRQLIPEEPRERDR